MLNNISTNSGLYPQGGILVVDGNGGGSAYVSVVSGKSGNDPIPLELETVNYALALANNINTAESAGLLTLNQNMFYDAATNTLKVKRGTYLDDNTVTSTVITTGTGITNIGTLDNLGDFKSVTFTVEFADITTGSDIVAIQVTSDIADTYTIFTSGPISDNGKYTFRISPTLNDVAGLIANDNITRTMNINLLYSVANDVTLTVKANWFN